MNGGNAGYLAKQFHTRTAALDRNCERYLATGYKRVEGWLCGLAALEIAALAEVQSTLGMVGPVCEIGVHHGRTLLLLHFLTQPGELAVGIDLYELLDQADGRERQARLWSNLSVHGGHPDRVRVVSEDSLNLTAGRVLALCGGAPRLFSIDGGRSARTTCHDLALACDSLCEGGVVMIHDYFQERWPEVSEGVCRFMTLEHDLHPIAIGGNKLFFTKSRRWVGAYHERLGAVFDGQLRKSVMFGEPVVLVLPLTPRLRITRTRVWKAIRNSAAGRMLRAVGRSVV